MLRPWVEVGDRVFVRRYPFYDQNIVVVLGGDQALVVDSRTTPSHARELLDDMTKLGVRGADVVVNTHGHHDHVFGNRTLRPAVIWGHERCATMIVRTGAEQLRRAVAKHPELAADLEQVELQPPDRTFADRAVVDLDGRQVELVYIGRGHTDNDIVVRIPDAGVLCAGDLLENGATPYFGDGYPMDWPVTVDALLAMTGAGTVVVPGHGDHGGLAFVRTSLAAFVDLAELATRVHEGSVALADAPGLAPYPAEDMAEPLARALAQLRGELDD
jgi:glyoxylase-like metal-dependent hydrolase (beta-lactamase superfamily II)